MSTELFRKRFAGRLSDRRFDLGLSSSEVARRASRISGVPYHTTVIRRWETGESLPNLEQALVICQVLEVPLLELTLPKRREPWIDGSLATLMDLDDQIAGRKTVTTTDLTTGLRETNEVQHDELATLEELPEVAEEAR